MKWKSYHAMSAKMMRKLGQYGDFAKTKIKHVATCFVYRFYHVARKNGSSDCGNWRGPGKYYSYLFFMNKFQVFRSEQ